jgi:hypothetical protein
MALADPKRAYLLPDAQPAIQMPITSIDTTATRNKTPEFGKATPNPFPTGNTENPINTGKKTRSGAIINNTFSAASGIIFSLESSLRISAKV